ncbi:MAG: DUF3565 domain-containing protein [Acidimicrobiaceae bacterium]|nr:DUF3565 domain-containing protein [Acidimicrobiaceae bacterium]MBO0748566.1 DUF3565 domain-containing protein [Acidimicrobiaceae bacterium]
MNRTITGFHRDEEGDWVAELSCLHNQHMRHRPPFQDRAWVLDEAGRAEHIGSVLGCPLCDRAELPADLVVSRTAGPFNESTIPEGLRHAHRAPTRTWGLLQVAEGSLEFWMDTDPPMQRHLTAGESQPIPPDVPHQVTVEGPVRLQVDFLTRP